MPWYAVVLIGVYVFNAWSTVRQIGEPREQITPKLAAFVVIADGLMIWAIVTLAGGS